MTQEFRRTISPVQHCAQHNTLATLTMVDCKNTSDDALQNYLNSINFKQTYFYTDIKLALGYAAVIISAITFAYDYKFGFDQTKHYTAATVAIYMLLNGAFTFWIWGVEKNIIYTGSLNGKKVKSQLTHYLTLHRLIVSRSRYQQRPRS